MTMLSLQPTHVGIVLLSLVSFTTTLYFFATPESLATRAKVSSEGILGPPDGEFDWCEFNFQYTTIVAEPFNSGTSALYPLVHVVGASLHNDVPFRLNLMLTFVSVIGIGSILFHSTLRYNEQLMDELPMFWLICSSASSFYRRNEIRGKAGVIKDSLGGLDIVLGMISVTITIVMLITTREDLTHVFARGVLSCTFSLLFVYSFVGGCIAGHEVDDMIKNMGKQPSSVTNTNTTTTATNANTIANANTNSKNNTTTNDNTNTTDINANITNTNNTIVTGEGVGLFAIGFWSFIVAVVSWIIDILFCSTLQSFYVYPNLHSMWHVASAYGVYCLMILLLAHAKLKAGREIRIVWKYGWIPMQVDK